MSQNSLVVVDGTGAQVIGYVNNALDALKTLSSGATAPASPSAYQFWADTTAGVLKIRDSTNAAWLPFGPLSGFGANVIKTLTGGTYTLSELEAEASSFEVNGTLTSNQIVVVPNNMPPFSVENLTAGAFTVTVKTSAGTGIVIGQGGKALLYCNGTNCEEISQAGAVTRMNSAANQTLTTTAATKVVLGTASHSVGGNLADTANNRITIKVPGVYSIRAHLRGLTTAAIQALTSQIYKNGAAVGPSTVGYGPTASANHLSTSNEVTDTCVSGDYYEVFGTGSVASGCTLQSGDCYLVVEKV